MKFSLDAQVMRSTVTASRDTHVTAGKEKYL